MNCWGYSRKKCGRGSGFRGLGFRFQGFGVGIQRFGVQRLRIQSGHWMLKGKFWNLTEIFTRSNGNTNAKS
jgi:hypothetical protein